ncbi:MAG: hypothetical protein HZA24_07270 [Nitrospirae bacterium]|nr:hypothetical protein [Nitrospirota bacterium]
MPKADPPRGQAAALLVLRLRALARAARDHAATLLVLYPLMAGTGLLLLNRVLADLGPPSAGATWLAWGTLAGCGAFRVRRRGRAQGIAADACLPLSRSARWLDAYLAAWVRLLPVTVLALLVAARSEGVPGWPVALAAFGLPLAAPVGERGGVARGSWNWRWAANGVTAATALLPPPWRPLVARDLLVLARGGVPGAGVNALLAVFALGWAVWVALTGGTREGLLAVALAAWALSATVAPLLAGQWRALWLARDAGVSATDLWRAKVAVAVLLGTLPGLVAAACWLPVAPGTALLCPVLAAAVGLAVGAAVMEGDGRPLLHGVASLMLALGVGVLALLGPAWLLLAPVLAAYLQKLGVPRLARRVEALAQVA